VALPIFKMKLLDEMKNTQADGTSLKS